MKFRRMLVDILVETSLEVCKEFVTCKKNKKILHVNMLKLLCGSLIASLLFCKNSVEDI